MASAAANYTEHLTIVVGRSEQKGCIVHKEFIQPHSLALEEYYDNSCKISKANTIITTDVNDHESMQVPVNWCHRKDTARVQPTVSSRRDRGAADNDRRKQLLKVYSLVDNFGMARLINDIANQSHKHCEPRRMTTALIKHAETISKPECGLLRYFIDNLASYLNKDPTKYQNQPNEWSCQVRLMLKADQLFCS